MINPDNDNNKEGDNGDEAYVRPDSNALCERMVSKLTRKSGEEKPKSKGKERVRSEKERPDAMSESEDSDEESDWSSAPASPSPLKKPRAFEKSDHLYEKQLEKERAQESEDWSWVSEEFLQEDRENKKDSDKSDKP